MVLSPLTQPLDIIGHLSSMMLGSNARLPMPAPTTVPAWKHFQAFHILAEPFSQQGKEKSLCTSHSPAGRRHRPQQSRQ